MDHTPIFRGICQCTDGMTIEDAMEIQLSPDTQTGAALSAFVVFLSLVEIQGFEVYYELISIQLCDQSHKPPEERELRDILTRSQPTVGGIEHDRELIMESRGLLSAIMDEMNREGLGVGSVVALTESVREAVTYHQLDVIADTSENE